MEGSVLAQDSQVLNIKETYLPQREKGQGISDRR
jgi:predicted GNAT family acetyltransferase